VTCVLDLEGIALEQLVAFTTLFFYSIFWRTLSPMSPRSSLLLLWVCLGLMVVPAVFSPLALLGALRVVVQLM
jgi:hypothetical protein